jgi:hypothetical protein
MAFVYLKVKSREEAQEILKEVLDRYKGQIISYDLEELGRIDLSDASIIAEVRHVLKKGGSLQVNIPKSIIQYMGLSPDSLLLFVVRRNIEHVYVTKVLSLSHGKRTYALGEQKE